MSKFTHSLTSLSRLSALSLALVLPMSATALSADTAKSDGTLSGLFAHQSKSKFLPVHQAFNVSASQQGDTLAVTFGVTPEHYVYKDKIKLTLPDGVSMGAWSFNKPHTMIDDPEFGRVAVFEEDVVATVKLTTTADVTAPISIRWQGCAKAGLCYPPETLKTTISLTGNAKKNPDTPSGQTTVANKANQSGKGTPKDGMGLGLDNQLNDKSDLDKTSPTTELTQLSQAGMSQDGVGVFTTQNTAPDQTLSAPTSPLVTPVFGDEQGNALTGESNDELGGGLGNESSANMASSPNAQTSTAVADTSHQAVSSQSDPFGINKNPALAVLLLFLAGLLLSFTPCVYPMIPIVANIVAHNKSHTALKGFALSGSYGLGVATAYGVLGGLIAWFGQAVGVLGLLQNPYVLGVFAIIFALLALYMFDIIKITLPSGVRDILHRKSQSADDKLGSVGGSFVAGALSALVVSPCVSAPMAGALTAVSASGSVPFGFIVLFSLGFGLSIPLMFIGLAQGKFMPKAGEWMNRVKEFCGLLLLAVSLSLLERLLFSPVMLIIWAVWFAMTAVWLFRMKNLASHAFALVGALWAVCLVVGASMGANDPWRPLAKLGATATVAESKADIKISSLSELDPILTRHEKVLVDVTADWCVECRIMERTLFTNRPAALADYQVVKLDITETNDDSRAVLARYGLFGPPALLIYKQGQLQTMLLGETKRADFETVLAQF
ncbi:Thiol:disulfide interchange protein DsbD precursor [Moraxella lacunata]|uniref:Thiol:disulfide interchange protein DsbD n=1 Tax=Moraxella lacunata TaxID=477 RepID=A0A378TSN4_MORLA|nr:protein-disulfide reductase DsbD domain-containing protein [Moraxella lacunata]STZ63747.1 Thiol:disulfide interchange protein DsbD precursor [Moraxella lacunata]